MTKNYNRRSEAAMKAVRTKRARAAFKKRFGDLSYSVISKLAVNAKASFPGVSKTSRAAYLANLTRGVYRQFIDDCNFT